MPDDVSAKKKSEIAHQKGLRVSASQQIYAALRQQIIDLTLPPGTQLSKKEIALTFGVSQTPVREALMLLEEEGLVDIFPQSRTEVAYIDVQSAREAHFLRCSVEMEIARSLCGKITETQLIDLRSIVQHQSAHLKANDLAAFAEADSKFHRGMYEMANVGGLWDIINARRAHLDRLRHLHLPIKDKACAIIKDHTAIINAIASGSPEAAEFAVREHIKGTVSATEDIRAHFPEHFSSPIQ
tara:strand:+ start:49338 stop:50060 length:723 start_codon:yes stop_codon:yes gene_type:complete